MRTSATWAAGAAALALLPLGACTRTEQAAGSASTATQAVMQAQTNPTLSTTDAYFMDQAARGGLAQVSEGQLAAKQAHEAAVRRYAAQMVTDHTKVNTDLNALAQQKRITLPTMPSDAQQRMMSQLQGLTGSTFDHTYLDQQVALQRYAVDLYRNEAKQGTDADVKALAARVLPELEQHLSEAERLGGHAGS
jgi:putative membrane protein